MELRRGASGEPEFHPLPPIPQGMALSAPASWPGKPPHGDASAGAEVAFLLTVAPDGSIISVARVGAPAAARDMVDTLEALLRQSRFVPYTAGEPATLALFVSVAGSGPER